MSTCQVAPALAAGNTVVLKPATYTRLSALLFAEICAVPVLLSLLVAMVGAVDDPERNARLPESIYELYQCSIAATLTEPAAEAAAHE